MAVDKKTQKTFILLIWEKDFSPTGSITELKNSLISSDLDSFTVKNPELSRQAF